MTTLRSLTASSLFAGLLLGAPHLARAQYAETPLGETIAFVNVHTITMGDDQVRPDQVLLVRSGRIVALGSRNQIPVPDGARVIDGGGRYLVPGIVDAHVHLDGDGTRRGTSRDSFGDGPLYLAHGVTSVVNMRGLPLHLEWRAAVERGELIGPTIYTAGEFINEPRVVTPDDVAREVAAQKAAGVDLLKFHEIYSRDTGYLTTVGLSIDAYRRLMTEAEQAGLPLVGHAPVNLGLEPVLETRQSLAHMGALSQVYFLPMLTHVEWLAVTAAAFGVMTLIAVTSVLATVVNRWRVLTRPPRAVSRVRELAGLQLLAATLAAASAILFLPGGPLFASSLLRMLFTAMIVVVAAATTAIVFATVTIWSEQSTSRGARVQAVMACLAGTALAWAAVAFWVPIVWRSSDRGIAHLAGQLRDAGVTVQTTLVAYDAIGGPGRQLLTADPVIGYLRPDVQARWRRLRTPAPRLRYTAFMREVTGALHRAGVPLVAGTDAMGYPMVAPGSSMHRELDLLVESGLSPYAALRAATVAPAILLQRELEFGRLAPARRADLLLVNGNPLEDIRHLRAPEGVMARGRWFTRAELDQLLRQLEAE
jgi:cytosine/adenosine deaminase-related metal-dependent hydrolase